MENIVVFGASGLAKIVVDIIERSGAYRIVGLIDAAQGAGSSACGYPIIGQDADLPRLREVHAITAGVIAIGDNWQRARLARSVSGSVSNWRFASAVHPSVQVARGATIGAGTIIMAGAVINSDARLGAQCLICTGASIDHDNQIEDFVSLAPKAATGGNVRIGAFTAIGMGATIIHGINIGTHAVIGAGATVVGDVESYVVAYGSPAKVIRARKAGDAYL